MWYQVGGFLYVRRPGRRITLMIQRFQTVFQTPLTEFNACDQIVMFKIFTKEGKQVYIEFLT